jgi:hypothetical protein
MTRVRLGLLLLAVASGCNNGGATTASVLTSMSLTGGVVGGKGKARITFASPAGSDTQVTLTPSMAGIVSLPAQVTVPKGSSALDVPFDAVAVGFVTVSATAGDITVNAETSVVNALVLNDLDDSQRLQTGASSVLWVYTNVTVADATTVNITVDDPTTLTVPSTVVIPPFASAAPIPITALKSGGAVVSATLGTQTVHGSVTIVDYLSLTSVYVASAKVEAGADVRVYAYLNAIPAGETTITLTSSDTSVGASPDPIIIVPGTTSGYGSFHAAAAGSTTLTFSTGASSLTSTVTVVASATLQQLSGSSQVGVGTTGSLNVYFDAALATPRQVTLTSSDPSVLTIPTSIIVTPGGTSNSIYFNGVAPGNATITATSGSTTLTFAVQVTAQSGGINYLSVSGNVLIGGTVNIYISTYGPGTLNLTSSNPSVLAVPPTVTTTGYVQLAVPALAAGTTIITATDYTGTPRAANLTVFATLEMNSVQSYYNTSPGLVNQMYVPLNAAPLTAATLTVSSSNSAVATVPSSVTIPVGNPYVYVPIAAVANGNSVITFTLNGNTRSTIVYVSQPSGTGIGGAGVYGNKLQVGASTVGYLNTNTPLTTDVTVTLTTTTPGIISVPSTAIVSAGSTQVTWGINAIAAGSTTLSMTANGITQKANITVVTTPTFTWNLGAVTMTSGTSTNFQISSDCALAKDAVFTLASDTTSSATVNPASLTLPATYSAPSPYFNVQAVAAGTPTITATSGATTLTQQITVN